jgi:hypothetical protein
VTGGGGDLEGPAVRGVWVGGMVEEEGDDGEGAVIGGCCEGVAVAGAC